MHLENKTYLMPENKTYLMPESKPALMPENRTALMPENRTALMPENRTALMPENRNYFMPENRNYFMPESKPVFMPSENRAALMRRVQAYGFVLYELHLFLNTHPTDQKALEYFHKYKELRSAAAASYVAKYGPLVANDVISETTWNWIDTPWPWEREV